MDFLNQGRMTQSRALMYFAYLHLPPHLQEISAPWATAAYAMLGGAPEDTVRDRITAAREACEARMIDGWMRLRMYHHAEQALAEYPLYPVRAIERLLEAKDAAVRACLPDLV